MRIIRRVEQLVPSLPNKKRVAAYARVSSGKDAMLHSLSAQISYYSAYIQKHSNWEYAGVYADEAMTGTKNNRDEFNRLIQDCRDGHVDIILTKSISRFARNTVDLLEAVRELRDINVEVYFERENINSMSGDGELMLTILASYAQEESRSVSENCKWRIRKRFAEGEIVNLRFMFGYHLIKGKIKIDPEKAAIIRMIFEDYISGMGGGTIANKLNEMNVLTVFGGVWNSKRVIDIIKNEKYAGNALLQKKYVTDHLTKKLVRNKNELPMYFAEDTHPAIIDIKTFERAQLVLKERIRLFGAKSNTSTRYPFSGIIKCGSCGRKYQRKARNQKAAWQCSTYLKQGKTACPAKQIPETILLTVAAEVLGLNKFNEGLFADSISEIHVMEFNLLIFVFRDGHEVETSWQDRSRAENWTDEMREAAHQKSIERSRDIWQGQKQ